MAARLAVEAAERGTFGVGGVIVDESGAIVETARNRVLEGGVLRDPTAHVERQLIDQAFAAGRHGPLDIVSSLEPCMMCAGSILRAGLRCVSLTDDRFAGVGVREGFRTLPDELRARAEKTFGSAGVEGLRTFAGEVSPRLREPAARVDFDAAVEAFQRSLEEVRNRVTGVRRTPSGGMLPVSYWVAGEFRHTVSDLPEVIGARSAHAMVAGLADSAGRLLCAAGATPGSPTRTAVTECIQLFTAQRAYLEERLATDLAPARLSLLIHGEFADPAEAILSLGAAGSFVESELPVGRAPFVQLLGASEAYADRMAAILARFPPFYVEYVGLRVGRA
jgi:tRNA(Arg) A34 adenosine deaminase TadA